MSKECQRLSLAAWILIGTVAVAPATQPAWAAENEIVVERVKADCPEGEDDCAEQRIQHRILLRGGHHGDAHFGWHGQGKSGYLGVELTDLTPELRAHFEVPVEAGILVAKVREDSPAFRAGLEVGDIITAVEGENVGSAAALAGAIRGREEGEAVDLEVWRDGGLETVTAVLETRTLAGHHAFVVCEEGEDCPRIGVHRSLRCPEGREGCRIEVECRDGGCICRVDGEERACEELEK